MTTSFEVHLCLAKARRGAELTVAAEMARLRTVNPRAAESVLYGCALGKLEINARAECVKPINPRNLKVLV